LTHLKLRRRFLVVNNPLIQGRRVGRKGPEMELLVALAAFVLVDVLAVRYGTDSRPLPIPKNSPRYPRDN